jgi:hypothetical protein
VVAVTAWRYVLPHVRENADMGGRQSPLSGVYRVERFVSDGRVLPAEAADAPRWREVAINRFGDYVRIRRMDDTELLWAPYPPGTPFRFSVAGGGQTGRPGSSSYTHGDWGRVLSKTSRTRFQLSYKALTNYRGLNATAKPGSDTDSTMRAKPGAEPFTLNVVREGSDHVSVQGRVDGAEISADLLRISNNTFAFFKP